VHSQCSTKPQKHRKERTKPIQNGTVCVPGTAKSVAVRRNGNEQIFVCFVWILHKHTANSQSPGYGWQCLIRIQKPSVVLFVNNRCYEVCYRHVAIFPITCNHEKLVRIWWHKRQTATALLVCEKTLLFNQLICTNVKRINSIVSVTFGCDARPAICKHVGCISETPRRKAQDSNV